MITEPEMQDLLIERYLAGQLQGEELAAFEIRMMDDIALFEAVQVAAALRNAVKQEAASLSTMPESEQPISATVIPFRTWLRQPLSMAASLLVAVLGVHLVQSELKQAPTAETNSTPSTVNPAAIGIGSVFLLETTRGDEAIAFSGPPPYLFQIDIGPGTEGEGFTLQLRDAAGKEVLNQPGLMADGEGWLRLLINEKLDGAFTLSAIRTSNGAVQVEMKFAVRQ